MKIFDRFRDTVEKVKSNFKKPKEAEVEKVAVRGDSPFDEEKHEEIVVDDSDVIKEIPEGLTSEEVAAKVAEGKVNVTNEKHGKSYLQIIKDNLFTFFNLIWAIVTAVLVVFNSYENLVFLMVVVPNLLIAILQESRAKATVEKLSVTTDPKATVVRDGKICDIKSTELVEGDVMRIDIGRQVLSDSVVISGIAEANESMITGESVPIKKQAGDIVYAGSFLVSGSIFVKVEKVGKENYIHTLESAAKNFKAPTSNLFRDLNRLIKSIGGFMIPLTLALVFCNWLFYKNDFSGYALAKMIVEKTCGSIVGMIPAGIYLLVTLTLSLSVMTLARKKTLVQDMYSIEMLASADVVCLDKTGTITDGTMQVSHVVPLADLDLDEITRIMSYLNGSQDGANATSLALISKFGKEIGKLNDSIPFSSSRKYSAADIEEVGSYAVGAPHFVPCDVSEELEEMIEKYANEGERVILLVKQNSIHERGKAIALFAISDRIRPAAKETIEKFQSQGVTVKVISGDHAATVSSIAKKVGIIDADKYISCEHLTDEELVAVADDHAVFGRVTPEQKVLLVKTLKAKGHTVAMTGDGVNDTLALKESNCAIAMADGSEVARKIASIVLMNSDFATLPDVVREGRRCINNVRQSAVLYLMKTLFTIFISLFSIFTVSGYPFAPNNFFFLELFIIGLASVLLALEPNDKRIEGSFLNTVIIKSTPCAVSLFIPTLVIMLIGKFSNSITPDARNAVAMCVVTFVGLLNLFFICRPYTKWRVAVVTLVTTLVVVSIAVSSYIETVLIENEIFGLAHAADNPGFLTLMLVLGVVLTVITQFFRGQLEAWIGRMGALKEEKEHKEKEFVPVTKNKKD